MSLLSLALLSPVLAINALSEAAAKNDGIMRDPAEIEAIVRLQIFLDEAEFSPGRIDGSLGQFTYSALSLYREARDGQPSPVEVRDEKKPDTMPEVGDLDLSRTNPVFRPYLVTAADLESVGDLPDSVPEQAKSKAMTYRSAAEAIAEKFHTDATFLEDLNPGKTAMITAGDSLMVPNVTPFELSRVKAGDIEAEAPAAPTTSVKVDTTTSMLRVFENEKLIAAYPVTIGAGENESPVGDWKVTGISGMPNFRYDKSMLKEGVRSDNFHLLPPGPNNPVGVTWIQLNKSGIGLHGTSEPETIGRSSSHGCVRLANWDIVRLAEKMTASVPVEIH